MYFFLKTFIHFFKHAITAELCFLLTSAVYFLSPGLATKDDSDHIPVFFKRKIRTGFFSESLARVKKLTSRLIDYLKNLVAS